MRVMLMCLVLSSLLSAGCASEPKPEVAPLPDPALESAVSALRDAVLQSVGDGSADDCARQARIRYLSCVAMSDPRVDCFDAEALSGCNSGLRAGALLSSLRMSAPDAQGQLLLLYDRILDTASAFDAFAGAVSSSISGRSPASGARAHDGRMSRSQAQASALASAAADAALLSEGLSLAGTSLEICEDALLILSAEAGSSEDALISRCAAGLNRIRASVEALRRLSLRFSRIR